MKKEFITLVLLLIFPGAAARAQTDVEARLGPLFSYDGHTLRVLVHAAIAQDTTLSLRSQRGHTQRKRLHLKAGENLISLAVNDDAAHRITFKLDGETRSIWANRGIWFSVPKKSTWVRVAYPRRGFSQHLEVPNDVILGRGYRAEVTHGGIGGPLSVGRIMGFEEGRGLKVMANQALVVVTRATVSSVRLTIAERGQGKTMRYWDYPLSLGQKAQRYVVPLTSFRLRGRRPRPGKIKRLYSFSITAASKAKKGDLIEVYFVGITRAGPRIGRISRRRGAIIVRIQGPRRPGLRLWVAHRAPRRSPREIPVGHRRRVQVTGDHPDQCWLCYRDRGISICDPPDAPRSSYTFPPRSGKPLLLDAFDTPAAVNAFRLPVTTFGSSSKVERAMTVRRQGGALVLSGQLVTDSAYMGYMTPVPAHVDRHLRTLEIRVRGQGTADTVRVGLRDHRGREPKITLASYLDRLDETWRVARIPLVAFRAVVQSFAKRPKLGPLARVSVVVQSQHGAPTQQLALADVRLVPQLAPVVLDRFDSEPRRRTALGGVINLETGRGGKIAIRRVTEGKHGRGLGVKVSSPRPSGFALISLALGRLDLRAYTKLCLWVRSTGAIRESTVYLKDGRTFRRMPLRGQTIRATPSWRRVCLPLSAVDRRVRRNRVTQLVFAWENQTIPEEKWVFDDIVVE